MAVRSSGLGSGGPLEDLLDPPPLVLGQGASLHDQHAITDVRRVLLVVRLEPLRALDNALVPRVPEGALHRDHTRLAHLVADHQPNPGLQHASPPPSRAAARASARAGAFRRGPARAGPGRCAPDSWPSPSRPGTGG